jgi:fatty-acid desaturase
MPATIDRPEVVQLAAAPESRHEHPRLNWRRLDWKSTTAIGLLHLGCIAAPFTFSWSSVAVAAFLWWACGGLGVCLCYHRLLTHRSFKTPKPVEYALAIIGTANWQGGPIKWVGEHRLHHKHSDGDLDPHSPKHGFNWAHVFWCLMKPREGHDPRNAAKDLQRDPIMAMIDRYHFVPQLVLAGVLYGAGELLVGNGLGWLVWGVCVRTVFTFHATWFVNSAGHTWGYRNYTTTDDSRNNWWVSILAFGEGWHNNHHAAQRSAAHGHRWYEIDLTYLTIRAMGLLGLATNIVKPGAMDHKH